MLMLLLDRSMEAQPSSHAIEQITYRARPANRGYRQILKIEFEAANLAAAIQRLNNIKNQGDFVIETDEKRLGTLHIVKQGQWWFSSI